MVSSHQMDDLAALCSAVTLLAHGRVVFSGPVANSLPRGGRLDYRVLTSDADTTRRVIAGHPGLELVTDRTRLRLGADAVVARGPVSAVTTSSCASSARASRSASSVRWSHLSRRPSSRSPAPTTSSRRRGLPDEHDDREHETAGTTTASTTTASLPEEGREPERTETALVTRPAGLGSSVRFELLKLLAQWRVRIVLVACWVAPAGFIFAASGQSSLPSDTVFGRSMSPPGGQPPSWCSASPAPGRSRC